MFHSLVLAAVAFIIFCRAEYLGAEKTIPLRLERTIVNCFRLFYFAMRTLPDLIGR